MAKAKMQRKMDFEKLIPTEFRGQDVNGSLRAGNAAGWNQNYQFSEMPADSAKPTWKNANRTGE